MKSVFLDTNNKRQTTLIAFLTFATVISVIWLASTTIFQVLDVKDSWSRYSQNAADTSYNLSKIQSTIGYGGFIHNFKNLVLRKEAEQIPKINEDLLELGRALTHFSQLNLSEQEKTVLTTIKSTFERYTEKYNLAKKLIVENASSEEIDQLVKVDDTQAILAFNTLAQSTFDRSLKHQNETDASIAETVNLILLSALAIPAILFVGWILIRFVNNISKTNQELERNKNFLDTLIYSIPDAMMSVNAAGMIKKVNQEAVKFFGYSEAELLKMSVSELIPKRYRDNHSKNVRNYFHANYSNKAPMANRDNLFALKKDKSEVPVDIRLGLINDPGDKITIATIRDISERIVAQKELKKSQALLAEAQRIAKLGSWEWNLSENLINLSEESMRFLGIKKQDINEEFDVLLKNVHPDDRERVREALREAVENHQSYNIEHRILDKEGHVSFVREQGEVVTSEDQLTKKLIGTMLDITGYKNEQLRLLQSASVFEYSSDAIVITDSENRIVAANNAYAELTGYSKEEAIGKNPGFSKSRRHDRVFYEKMWSEIQKLGHWQGEIWDRRKNGEVYPKWLSISALKDQSGQVSNYIGVFNDISKSKKNEEELWQLAHHDSLTGLPNRMLFISNLEQAYKQATRGNKQSAVMFLDLDKFKPINDKHGHVVGDAVLKEVAERLTSSVRQADTVARYGGDEFTILIQDLENLNDLDTVVNKILENFRKPIIVNSNELYVGVSIGVCIFPEKDGDVTTVIKHADLAMYYVKEQGRNGFQVYDESIKASLEEME